MSTFEISVLIAKIKEARDMLEAVRGHCGKCEQCAAGYVDKAQGDGCLCAIDDTIEILDRG